MITDDLAFSRRLRLRHLMLCAHAVLLNIYISHVFWWKSFRSRLKLQATSKNGMLKRAHSKRPTKVTWVRIVGWTIKCFYDNIGQGSLNISSLCSFDTLRLLNANERYSQFQWRKYWVVIHFDIISWSCHPNWCLRLKIWLLAKIGYFPFKIEPSNWSGGKRNFK